MGMKADEFAEIVRERLRETGQTMHGAATSHGLARDAVSRVLAGHVPRLERVAAICDALGLELYVGPKRQTLDQLDIDAAALALADMRNRIIQLANGELDGAVVVHTFLSVYFLNVSLIDSLAAMGRTREEAADLLRRRSRLLAEELETPLEELSKSLRALEPDEVRLAKEADDIVHEAISASLEKPDVEETPAPREKEA